jgi:dynein assembly factor 1, axonemal
MIRWCIRWLSTHCASCCRYLQQNRIKELGDLSFLPVLSTLNISYNCISSLAGLSCPQLETLICTHNYLKDADSIAALLDCSSLQTVDIQNNKIEDPSIVEIFAKMPNVCCLYLKGNPAVSKIKQCRYALCNMNREDRAVPRPGTLGRVLGLAA